MVEQKGIIQNNLYLQGQKCTEGIFERPREGSCGYYDDIV